MSAANENVVGAPLKAAFLRGETVVASRFAEMVGSTRQAVSDQLANLTRRGLVKGERIVTATGRLTVYACVDAAGMAAWEPRITRGRPRKGLTLPPLMEAWGMRIVDIDLPTTQHFLNVEADELEAA